MRKNFVKAALFGLLMFGAMSTVVSCKDYDDDITRLEQGIEANKASIEELKASIDKGQWVTSIEGIENGFTITMNDGSTKTITGINGEDGADGADGVSPIIGIKADEDGVKYWTLNDEWLLDAEGNKVRAEGKDGQNGQDGQDGQNGQDGEDGKSPRISEDGFWEIWDAEQGKYVTTNTPAGTSVYVTFDFENPIVRILHIWNNTSGEWESLRMPVAQAITSIKAVGLQGYGQSWDDASAKTISLYYSWSEKDADFDGLKNGNKHYAKGDLLTSSSTMISALINPANIDAADVEKYYIWLKDSKGNAPFQITKVAQNESEDPLTRSANRGIYDLYVNFADGLTSKQISDLRQNNSVAYALSTFDASGNEIISEYDVKVRPVNMEENLYARTIPVEYKKKQNLYDVLVKAGVNLNSVVDYTFAFENSTANQNAIKNIGATLEIDKEKGTATVYAEKEGTVAVTVTYLTVKGNKKTVNVNLKFQYVASEAQLQDINYTIKEETDANNNIIVSKVIALDLSDYADILNQTDEYGNVKYTINATWELNEDRSDNYRAGTGLSVRKTGGTGTPSDPVKYALTVDNSQIAPSAQIGTLAIVNNLSGSADYGKVYKYLKVFVNVDANVEHIFSKKAGYFKNGQAYVYGTDFNYSKTAVEFNLDGLYNEKTGVLNNFSYEEVKPSASAPAWLAVGGNGENLSVAKGSQYGIGNLIGTSRTIKVKYRPFGNRWLDIIEDSYTLNVVSAVDDFAYASATQSMKAGESITLKAKNDNSKSNLTYIDLDEGNKKDFAVTSTWSNERFAYASGHPVVVSGDAEFNNYLEFSAGSTAWTTGNETVTITKKPGVAIVNPVKCTVYFTATDAWGKKQQATVTITVNPAN